jgi:hypothetical protein
MNAYFEQIEDYIRGKLNASEIKDFEAQLKKDPNLAKQLSVTRIELESYELLVADSLRHKMNTWGSNQKPIISRVWWAAAASIALLAVAFIWVNRESKPVTDTPSVVKQDTILPKINPQQKINDEPQKQIASENKLPEAKNIPVIVDSKKEKNDRNQPLPNKDVLKPQTTEKPTTLSESENLAYQSFEQPNYDNELRSATRGENDTIFTKALILLKDKKPNEAQAILAKINELDATYYLSVAYFNSRDYNKAIPILEKLSQNLDYINKEKAEWLLALSYVAQNDKVNAKKVLTDIKEDLQHTYKEKAGALLLKVGY